MLALLRQRSFGLLWLGGLISFIGDWTLLTALPYYVYQQTGSTLATATMTVAAILPSVLLSSVAGVFVDRWDRRRILVVANLLQMLAVLLLLVGGSGLVWLVYSVALVQSAIRAFAIPAESALLPTLVGPDQLLAANALNSLNNTLARLIGPPLGGLLLRLFGLEAVVLLDSISFACAAALIALIARPGRSLAETPPPAAAPAIRTAAEQWASFWREWREGLTAIRRDRLIRALMVVLGLTTFGGTMLDPLYPAFVRDILGAGALGFGSLLTAQAVGGIIGSLAIGQLRLALPTARILAWGNMLIGGMLLLQFSIPSLPLALLIAFLIGPEQVAAGAALQTLLQHSVADALRGRVFGAIGTTGALLSLLGSGAAGPLSTALGLSPSLLTAAGLIVIAGMLGLILLPQTAAGQEQAEEEAVRF